MENEKAQALTKRWIERLGLKDWTIKVICNCHPDSMTPGTSGNAEYVESIKCATIRILDEKYYGDRIRPFNFEQTLIHELLHLKFCLLEDPNEDSLQSRVLHQIVDDLARAFVPEEDEAPSEEGEKNA